MSCLKTAPGRGDCEHFVGLPLVEDTTTTDIHGKPHNWCIVCWLQEKNRRLQARIAKYQDALIWCSGSSDFGPGGLAHVGWEKLCRPLISEELKNLLPKAEDLTVTCGCGRCIVTIRNAVSDMRSADSVATIMAAVCAVACGCSVDLVNTEKSGS